MVRKGLLKLLLYMFISILVFAAGYDFLCGGDLLLRNSYHKYNIIVENSKNISNKESIYFRGVPIGRVCKKTLSDDNRHVNITFYINKDIKITKNSIVLIQGNIWGNNSLELEIVNNEGDDDEIVEENSTLQHKYIKSDTSILIDNLKNIVTEISGQKTHDESITTQDSNINNHSNINNQNMSITKKILESIDLLKNLLVKTAEKIEILSQYMNDFKEKNKGKSIFTIKI